MGRKKGYFQFRQFGLWQRHAAQKVGTDSDLLGNLAEGGERILDIGTGTGVIALMMAQRCPQAQITAVEIDDNAVMDAEVNFRESPWADRLTLVHSAFQDYVREVAGEVSFDCVVCNPPYFDKSLEAPDLSRTRARHTSALPFEELIGGAYRLLDEGGVFSVCIPPEVFDVFTSIAREAGFSLKENWRVKSVPEATTAKRYVLTFCKGDCPTRFHTGCMRNADRSVSQWYKQLTSDFLL